MKKAIKWLLIAVGSLVALVIVALLVIPMFVDVQEYKPVIEKRFRRRPADRLRSMVISGSPFFHGWVWPSRIFI